MSVRSATTAAGLAFALAWAAPALADDPPVELKTLAPTASVLMGTDGNVLVVADASGALLVDDERGRDLAEMQDAVKKLTSGPVRYVINTHWHLDHSGANAAFARAGATIIAQRSVRARLSSDQYMAAYKAHIPASPPQAWPTLLVDEEMRLHFGGETLELRHTPAAHTDGDLLVKLDKANVLHMGDVFFNGLFPFIDRSSAGSVQGMMAAVDAGLSMSDARTVIVPAHGPLATRQELVAYRAMLAEVTGKVKAAIAAGRTMEEVRASHPAAAYAAHLEGDQDRFVDAVYDSLTKA